MTLRVERLVGKPLNREQMAVIAAGIEQRLGVKEYRPDGEYLTFRRANILRNVVVSFDEKSRLPINQTDHAPTPHFNPVTVGYYGLECLSKYFASGDAIHLEAAKPVAEFALSGLSENGTWPSPYSYHWFAGRAGRPLRAGWPSALSQGYLMSFLARMYTLEPRNEYLDCCRRALRPFMTPVAEGGVLRLLNDQTFGPPGEHLPPLRHVAAALKSVARPWLRAYRRHRHGTSAPAINERLAFFEEYPTEIPSLVLNGFMFALFGLYDVWKIARDDLAGRLYRMGEAALERMLPFYDLGHNTAYDLTHIHPSNWRTPPNACRKGYHQTHLIELSAMNAIEKNKYLDVYYRWLLYDRGIAISGN